MRPDPVPVGAVPAPDAGDVRALARVAGLPIPDAEVEAVVAPLQAMCVARAVIEGWRKEGTDR